MPEVSVVDAQEETTGVTGSEPINDEWDLEARVDFGIGVDIYEDLLLTNKDSERTNVTPNKKELAPTPSSPLKSCPRINCSDKPDGSGNQINEPPPPPVHRRSSAISCSRVFQCYIGNLNWWTTDKDLEDGINATGVTDLIEIKFFENSRNGMCKGFCMCTVGCIESLNKIRENLTKQSINGLIPHVSYVTKEALAYFDSQDQSRPKFSPSQQESLLQHQPPAEMKAIGGPRFGSRHPLQRFPSANHNVPPFYHHIPGFGYPHPPPYSFRGPQQRPPMMTGFGHRHPLAGPPLRLGVNFHWNRHPHPMSFRPRGYVTTSKPTPFCDINTSPLHPPGSSPILSIRQQGHFSSTVSPIATSTPPAPHLNPEFFHDRFGPLPSIQPATKPHNESVQNPIAKDEWRSRSLSPSPPSRMLNLSFEEYEEAMSSNASVTSAAITRAVQDAASGDFENAIETLETAMSLLRQSKVASDDRVKVQISSLQDTLCGIEANRYKHSSRREREKSLEYHRSRRSYSPHNRSSYRRSRSRTRIREYRSRSRSHRALRTDSNRRSYFNRNYDHEECQYVPQMQRDCDRERFRERERSRHNESRRRPYDRSQHDMTYDDSDDSFRTSSNTRYK